MDKPHVEKLGGSPHAPVGGKHLEDAGDGEEQLDADQVELAPELVVGVGRDEKGSDVTAGVDTLDLSADSASSAQIP